MDPPCIFRRAIFAIQTAKEIQTYKEFLKIRSLIYENRVCLFFLNPQIDKEQQN